MTHMTVGDVEHAEIIQLYIEEGLSMNKIAEKLGRSSKVPHKHIHKHNSKVEGARFCPACRRVKSELDKTLARMGKILTFSLYAICSYLLPYLYLPFIQNEKPKRKYSKPKIKF